ncbi:MAG: response regulator [Candidatus Melainabacteria bacterium]|nr:response regulator [Candidatus Melainabacteria bacterium]
MAAKRRRLVENLLKEEQIGVLVNTPQSKAILVLDDDSYFRNLVSNLLKRKGYRTIEASNPEEANRILATKEAALAIVDYRLPKTDGMSWIAQLREAGGNIPIVFCSGQRADAALFNKLRNVLGVSLILQKPIIPATFVQQIEDLLPNFQKVDHQEEIPWNTMPQKRQSLQGQKTTFAQSKDDLASLLKEATDDYLSELDSIWKDFVRLINDFNNNTENMQSLSEAMRIAHTVRGTAGSLNLSQISRCAGKLEDLMRNLDPDKSTDQEVIWSEIIRILAEGTSAVQEALLTHKATDEVASGAIANVLLISKAPEVLTLMQAPDVVAMANVIVAENTSDLNVRIDAAIIDLTNAEKESWAWAREIRNYANNIRLPLAFITPRGEKMSEEAKILCGASVTIESPVLGTVLQDAVFQLLSIGFENQPRILVVDDDEVLTRFVSSLLQTERMFTQSANNPITVPDLVAEFNPDLILMDVMMPVMTGYEVCRMIRENPEWVDIPILFVTSQTSTDARAAAFAAGATDFLTKPILAEELITRVSTHIKTSARRQKTHGVEPVSGLLSMEAFMHQYTSMFQANKNRPVTVASVGLDNFDELSLTQGMEAAKRAALQLARLISLGLRAEDLICRYSDQGCIIAFAGVEAETVSGTLQMVHEGFSQIGFGGPDGEFKTSFSAGVAQNKNATDTAEVLIQASYRSMMRARSNKLGVVLAN